MPLRDVLDVAEVLEATGRAIPRQKWVDEFAAQAEDDALEGFF